MERRKVEWDLRIAQEAIYREQLGWYGLHVTLTVPKHLGKAFWHGEDVYLPGYSKRPWYDFVRKMTRISNRQSGRGRDDGKISYVANMEHGKDGDHHHIHALMWLENVPLDWTIDPNICLLYTSPSPRDS